MINVEKRGTSFAATIRGVDLSKALSEPDFAEILWAIGTHGVVCFPNQEDLTPAELHNFSARLGQPHVSSINKYSVPGLPSVNVLSNMREGGVPIGIEDAGQEWHSDLTYTEGLGFVNVLLARKVPMRAGKALGATHFTNTQLACEELPADLRAKLANATATHSLARYWEYVREFKGSSRPPLTEQQKRDWTPCSHPVLMDHPITGRKVIFVNPSFTANIDGMDEASSKATLSALYEHVLKDKYRYVHEWSVGDLLVFDLLGTWHNATADYTYDEHRLLHRCQVLATKVRDPAFIATTLKGRASAVS